LLPIRESAVVVVVRAKYFYVHAIATAEETRNKAHGESTELVFSTLASDAPALVRLMSLGT
jgi:hypothetical protein